MPAKTRKSKKKESRERTPPDAEEMGKVLVSLKAGAPLGVACEAAGIRAGVGRKWHSVGSGERSMAEAELGGVGEEPPEWMVEFAEEVEGAKAFAHDRALKAISVKMGTNWQAAAWYLERTMPERYGMVKELREGKGRGGGEDLATLLSAGFRAGRKAGRAEEKKKGEWPARVEEVEGTRGEGEEGRVQLRAVPTTEGPEGEEGEREMEGVMARDEARKVPILVDEGKRGVCVECGTKNTRTARKCYRCGGMLPRPVKRRDVSPPSTTKAG